MYLLCIDLSECILWTRVFHSSLVYVGNYLVKRLGNLKKLHSSHSVIIYLPRGRVSMSIGDFHHDCVYYS